MLHILSSNAAAPSKGLNELARKEGEDNIAWLARNLLEDDGTSIVMVGGRSPISFRLRVAQSHVRNDLLPSYWSHVMLLGKAAKNLASTPISEISLEPPDWLGFVPPTNGVRKGKLGQYRGPERISEYSDSQGAG